MKIALLVPGFSSDERDWCIPALLDLVRVLSAEVEVHVFALRWPRPARTYRVFGATVRAMGGEPAMRLRALLLWQRTLAAVASEHRRAPFDVLHAVWADEPAWLGARLAVRLHVPLVVSIAGGELVGLRDIGYGLQLLRGRPALIGWSLRRALVVGVGSHYLLDTLLARLPGPAIASTARLLPLGVDTDRFTPRPSSGTAHDRPLLLNVGSLSAVKDQARLIRLLPRMRASLAVAGDGPLGPSLRRAADQHGVASHVRWLGAVAHDALPPIYRDATMLVQTSRHESQGMAVLEAAASGVPVIGTPVGVLPEIGTACGGDDELVASVAELAADAGLRARRASLARAQVEQEFALQVCGRRFLHVYDELRERA